MSIFGSNVVGIDFHDHLVQFVDVSRRGRKSILNAYNRLALPEGLIQDGVIKDKEGLKSVLNQLFQTANPSPIVPGRAAVVLPSSAVFTHIFEFSSTLSEKDIQNAIPFEAETVIPFSIQEVIWDFSVLEKDRVKDGSGRQRVLFASVPSKIAQQFLDVFNELNIQSVAFGIDLDAIQHALKLQLKLEDTALVMDLGALSVNYTLVDHGVVKSFYSSPEAVNGLIQSITQETPEAKEIFIKNYERGALDPTQLKTIDEFLKRKYHRAQQQVTLELSKKTIKKVDRLVLTGEFANLPHFFDFAGRYFPHTKVEVGDPKTVLSIDDKRFSAHVDGKDDPVPYSIYFTSCIGIALKVLEGGHRRGLNLLPTVLKSNLHEDHRLWVMALVSVGMSVLSIIMAGVYLFLHQDLGFERVNFEIQKEAIERQLYGTRYMEVQKALVEFNKEVAILSKIDAQLFSLPTVLEQINALVPPEIQVVSQTFSDEALSFEIEGIAQDRDSILAFKKNLENHEIIESIDMPLSNFDRSSTIPFRVTIRLKFNKLPQYATK